MDDPADLSTEDLRLIFEEDQERARIETLDKEERIKGFLSEIPEVLHKHPVIQEALGWVASGVPLRPKDHAILSDALGKVLREHEQATTFWVPGDPL